MYITSNLMAKERKGKGVRGMGESPLSMYIEAPCTAHYNYPLRPYSHRLGPAGPFPDGGLITCVAGDHMIARKWGQVSIPD